MRRRDQVWMLILLILILIGIAANPRHLIIPAIVVGIVVLLYFFPPHRWRQWFSRMGVSQQRPRKPQQRGKAGRRNSQVKLRVIKGNKRDDEQDKPPRYH